MDDDCWLPGVNRPAAKLARSARICGDGEGLGLLLDGIERDLGDVSHAWAGAPGDAIEYRWNEEVEIAGARFVFDSNLANGKVMPCSYPQLGTRDSVPATLVRSFRIEAQDKSGVWSVVHREENNYQRLVVVPIGVRGTALRFIFESTWGAKLARIFNFEPLDIYTAKIPNATNGEPFPAVRSRIPDRDLTPPASAIENSKRTVRSA